MFEALLTLCLLDMPDQCRDVLLPGYEAQTLQACQHHASGSPMDWSRRFPDYASDWIPHCAKAKPPAIFQEIAFGVYAHRGIIADANPENLGDVANLGFIIGSDSVVVIDAGGSRLVGENVFRAIRAITDKPISHLILTHMHPDHTFGASVFSDVGAKIIGHARLAYALEQLGPLWIRNFKNNIGSTPFIGTEIPLPDHGVAETFTLDPGGRILTLRSWPESHTQTDLTVQDSLSATAFMGDLVFAEHAPALDGSVTGWLKLLKYMQDLPIAQIVPGHGGPVLKWPGGSDELVRYLSVLEHETRQVIDQGLSLHEAIESVARSEATQWQLFELFHPRNVTRVYTELEWE